MTDVIGWGGVETPLRRRRRLPRWLVVAGAVIAIGGVVAVPSVRAHLADGAAAWLRATWDTRVRYDDARAAIVQEAVERAGVTDQPVVEAVARSMDGAEATTLARTADAIAGRRMWAGDLSRAADAGVRALRSEVAALRRDAHAMHPAAGYFSDAATDLLVAAADRVIAAATAHHHAPEPRRRAVRLSAPTALLDRLARPTDRPTHLELVLTNPTGGRVVLDLDTGAETPLPPMNGLVYALGDRVVARNGHSVFVLDPRDGSRTTLVRGVAFVLGVDPDGVWVTARRGVRHFRPDGTPDIGWSPPPAGRAAVQATGPATLAFEPVGLRSIPRIWYPGTGHVVALPPVQADEVAAGGGRFVLFRFGGEVASVVDASTARVTRLRIRPALTLQNVLQPLSPDGDRLAVTFAFGTRRAAVIDLATGSVSSVPGPADLAPISWSADGEWLLLAERDVYASGGTPRIALWHVEAPRRLLSVRIPADTGAQPLAPMLVGGG